MVMSVYKEVFGLEDTNITSSSNADKAKPDTSISNSNNNVTMDVAAATAPEDNNNTEGDAAASKKKENANIITFVKVKNALIRVRLEESALNGRAK